MSWIKQALSSVVGSQAEAYARQYLEAQGLHFVCANYRCRTGEIDLIMQDQDTLVFVEVKYRSDTRHGHSVEFFHTKKRQKFEQAIMHYFQSKDINPNAVAQRIDVVGIEQSGGHKRVSWLKNV